MRISRAPLRHPELNKIIDKSIPLIEKNSKEIFDNIPEHLRNLKAKWFKIRSIFIGSLILTILIFVLIMSLAELSRTTFYIFLIIIIISSIVFSILRRNHKRKLEEYMMYINKNIMVKEILKSTIDNIPLLKFVDYRHVQGSGDLEAYRNDLVHRNARFSIGTFAINLLLLDKYHVQIRSGQFIKTNSKDKYNTKDIYNSAYIEILGKELQNDFIFSLFHEKKIGVRTESMEDEDFNNSFTLQTNDRHKIRVAFTPLSMERMIAQKYDCIEPKWWNLEKGNNHMLIRFNPSKWNDTDMCTDLKYYEKWEDLSVDIYSELQKCIHSFYNLLGLAIIPVVLG